MQPSVMPKGADHPEMRAVDFSRIAQDLQIRKLQVEAVVQLLDEGNTIPFITRYRKERTGGLNEDVLRTIQERIALLAADNSKRLEDLYLPYKPKKRTLATAAREKGLEPLALAIWNSDPAVANLGEILPTLVIP